MLTFQLHFLYDILYIIRVVQGVYVESFAQLLAKPPAPAAVDPSQPPSPAVHTHSSTDGSMEHDTSATTSPVHAAGSVASPTDAARALHSHPEVATGVVEPQSRVQTMAVDLPFELQVSMSSLCIVMALNIEELSCFERYPDTQQIHLPYPTIMSTSSMFSASTVSGAGAIAAVEGLCALVLTVNTQ